MRTCELGNISSNPADAFGCIVALALLALTSPAQAQEADSAAPSEARSATSSAGLAPSAFFAQWGVADEVSAGTVGAIWNIRWDALEPRWSIHVEASVSRWQSRDDQPSTSGTLTQFGLIPVFRYRLDDGRSAWFVDGGIGATVTSSVYRGGRSRFSTTFNFGDHLGVGYSFGAARKNELAFRIEHFSNAGIKHPNPGKNFVQLRFVRRFD